MKEQASRGSIGSLASLFNCNQCYVCMLNFGRIVMLALKVVTFNKMLARREIMDKGVMEGSQSDETSQFSVQ